MEKLTTLTLGAIGLGLAGLGYDACTKPRAAEPEIKTARVEFVEPKPAAHDCTSRETTISFEPESVRVSADSKAALARIAAEARACGKTARVVAEAADGDLERRRVEALQAMFSNAGVKAHVRKPADAASSGAGLKLVVGEAI